MISPLCSSFIFSSARSVAISMCVRLVKPPSLLQNQQRLAWLTIHSDCTPEDTRQACSNTFQLHLLNDMVIENLGKRYARHP